jgi:hypothetical protein
MGDAISTDARRVLALLERWGLLLYQDAKLPCVVSELAGGPIKGSWWAHSKGKLIFRVGGEVCHHEDVLAVKLIAGKETLVHRRHWPALAAIGMARENWQTRALSTEAKALLKRVDRERRVRTSGKPVKELERALLIVADGVHTESGAHAIDAVAWPVIAKERGLPKKLPSVEAARAEIDAAAARLAEAHGSPAPLAWAEEARARRAQGP